MPPPPPSTALLRKLAAMALDDGVVQSRAIDTGAVNVLSYARISADTERDGHGVEGQHAEHLTQASQRGWTVAWKFTDNHKSASKAGVVRDEFEHLIRALVRGTLDDGTVVHGAIIERFDRASRTHRDWEEFHDALISWPGRKLVIDGVDKDPYSEGFLYEAAISMVSAKQEPKKISARMMESHRRRAANGKPVGGNFPWGWKRDRVTLDPELEADARHVVQSFLGGSTVGSLVTYLNNAGRTTTKGNSWTSAALKVWLKNPRLCGLRLLNGQYVMQVDEAGMPTSEVALGTWQTLATVDEWVAIMERFKGNAPTAPSPSRRYLLSGFLRCGKIGPDGERCFHTLRGMANNQLVGRFQYSCPPKQNGGCAGVGRNGMRLETYVLNAVLSRLEAISIAERVREPYPEHDKLEKALADRASAIQGFDNGDGYLSGAVFFPLMESLEKKISKLQGEERRWMASQVERLSVPADIREQWHEHEGDLGWQRTMIGRVIHTVVVNPLPPGTNPRSAEAISSSVVIHYKDS